LLLNFWHLEGLELTEEQKAKFLRCTPAESRALREQYPASSEVTEARYEQFKQYKGGAVSWL